MFRFPYERVRQASLSVSVMACVYEHVIEQFVDVGGTACVIEQVVEQIVVVGGTACVQKRVDEHLLNSLFCGGEQPVCLNWWLNRL